MALMRFANRSGRGRVLATLAFVIGLTMAVAGCVTAHMPSPPPATAAKAGPMLGTGY
jgi:hypothetical protein